MCKHDSGIWDHIFAPIAPSVFLADYWETKPLIISRKSPGYYARFISLVNAINIMTSTELRETELRLVRNGTPLPVETYTRKLPRVDGSMDSSLEGTVNIERVLSEFHAGATIILDALQRKWGPLASLCRSLELFFHQGVQANVYLTPKHSHGFAAHYDTHDVFVLQVGGSKHWRIYGAPIELPLSSQPFPPLEHPHKKQFGEAIHEVDLEDGDCLYIPRGYVHEASACTSTSAHVTVGIIALTWADAFSEALQLISKQDVRFRKSLPVGFGNAGQDLDCVRKEFRELAMILSDRTDLEILFGHIFDRFVLTRSPALDGYADDLENLDRIDLKTPVMKRKGLVSRLKSEDQLLSISLPAKKVNFPKHIEPTLRFLAEESGEFTASSLPGNLDAKGRLVLVRRLVKEGYLTIKAKGRNRLEA